MRDMVELENGKKELRPYVQTLHSAPGDQRPAFVIQYRERKWERTSGAIAGESVCPP